MNVNSFLDPLQELINCTLCPRKCHVNRLVGELGYCKTDASFNIASICIHKGEEPVISGKKGICNVFFTNCNLQCIYCQNHQISDIRSDRRASIMELDIVVGKITAILDSGINLVGFVSPSHTIPQMKVIINAVNAQGYKPRWVYNSNGYDDADTLKSLEGIIDVYLPDFKYLDIQLSKKYSDAANYPECASKALREMYRQKGSAVHLDKDGIIESGMIIRHLVLPGALDNSRKVLRFIAEELSPRMFISLMSQYFPTVKAATFHPLNRLVLQSEYQMIIEEMENLEMYNGWIQEYESNAFYHPDFDRQNPFEE